MFELEIPGDEPAFEAPVYFAQDLDNALSFLLECERWSCDGSGVYLIGEEELRFDIRTVREALRGLKAYIITIEIQFKHVPQPELYDLVYSVINCAEFCGVQFRILHAEELQVHETYADEFDVFDVDGSVELRYTPGYLRELNATNTLDPLLLNFQVAHIKPLSCSEELGALRIESPEDICRHIPVKFPDYF